MPNRIFPILSLSIILKLKLVFVFLPHLWV
jgi:hypothetical protein